MSAADQKPRPDNVPEENVYKKTHWSIYLSYAIAVAALFVLVQAGS